MYSRAENRQGERKVEPSIGRIVHFVQKKPEGHGDGTLALPAVIVFVWGPTCVNLQVFTDGCNSEDSDSENPSSTKWVTSVSLDESAAPALRTWHWPART